MTISKVPTLQTYYPLEQKQRDKQSPHYTLKWRQGQLLVSLEQKFEQPHLLSLENEQWLVECLKHSPVRLVRIDPALDEASLKFWADACEQANKVVFLRLSAAHNLPRQRRLRKLIEWSAAALLLLVLSPVMLGVVCLMRVQSPEPIFWGQWCVGDRGKVFRLFKLRPFTVNAQTLEYSVIGNQKSMLHLDESRITFLGRWMCKSRLDKLPQLFNVLRFDMSLMGSRPLTLKEYLTEQKRHINL